MLLERTFEVFGINPSTIVLGRDDIVILLGLTHIYLHLFGEGYQLLFFYHTLRVESIAKDILIHIGIFHILIGEGVLISDR